MLRHFKNLARSGKKQKENEASNHVWHAIAHASLHALQKAWFIKSLQFSLDAKLKLTCVKIHCKFMQTYTKLHC